MDKKVKKIGLLCSGGDGPGMNAAIRSVVRYALFYGIEVQGIFKGYEGLIDNQMASLNHRSVANIIDKGGTILKTARSKRFLTDEGRNQAAANLKAANIDALVVIGGDGSYRGAHDLFEKCGVPAIGLPGTIDNDLYGTDQTIGCQTAVNTALEAIDKVRDTAHSMERIFVVEVMGNKSGYIALEVAIGSGAENVIIPEYEFDYIPMYEDIKLGHSKGKVSWIVIVSEGAGKAEKIAEKISQETTYETRFVVLGHIQRGGSPSSPDRILGTRLGAAAVDLILRGQFGKAVGIIQDKIEVTELKDAKRRPNSKIEEYLDLMKKLR